MEKNQNRCCRCGTIYNVKAERCVKCPHCGKEMEIDRQTGIAMYMWEVLLFLLIITVMIIPFLFSKTEVSEGAYALLTLGFIFIFVLAQNTVQKLALAIVYRTKGLTYVEAED